MEGEGVRGEEVRKRGRECKRRGREEENVRG
jgi:hypothetical protein